MCEKRPLLQRTSLKKMRELCLEGGGLVSTGAKDGLRSALADFSSNKVRLQIGRKVSLQATCRRMRSFEAFLYIFSGSEL